MDNNIIYDAYYLINLFNNDEKKVTQLQLQKLMYFFEAYYMNIKDVDSLYECNFNAWMFGPVAIPLYKKFKSFGEFPIEISEEAKDVGNNIDSEKKKLLMEIYRVFGELTSATLVNLTHMKDSPWYKKWLENDRKVVYGEKSYIDKLETKKWFKENFLSE